MSFTIFTEKNILTQPTRILLKRSRLVVHFSTFLAIGAFLLCLLVPLSPTPANSSDMAMALSSHSQQSRSPENQGPIAGTSHSEDILAALTIYLEARGESFAGKLAVAAVIRNRMHHKYHSDGTVKGTVLRAKQFEPWIGRSPEDVRFNPNNRKMRESLLAWELVQDGRNIVDGAVLFYNPTLVSAPRWAQVYQKVAKIGGHEFFNKHQI
ncbi:MAG: cell wall hydrolase [Nitrospirota bacterium]|nr:cell wall hydrolase [Nitrospirota bacterium]MDH5775628.1 cell wall hydrolase [Nitrospirota bacterium]